MKSRLYPFSQLKILEIVRWRLMTGGVLFSLLFSVVAWRLVDVSLLKGVTRESSHPIFSLAPPLKRADIVDCRGEIIATSLTTSSLYVNPRLIIDLEEAAQKLSQVMPDLSRKELKTKLQSPKNFVWIKRNLTPAQQESINRLGLPGLFFQEEEKRFYPHGPLFSHLVGCTDRDNKGISGVEKSFHEKLTQEKEPLVLSLDLRVQHAFRDELVKSMKEFQAIGAWGVIMDTKTGEMVASVSLPDFDPNCPPAVTSKCMFNNVTLGSFEMGSTFKIFTIALALDQGVCHLNSRYDATHPLKVGRFSIKDFRGKNRWLNVSEIFIYSSNIGTAQIALEVGSKDQKEFFEKLGFLKPLSLPLPEVGSPIQPINWNQDATIMTLSYGYGLSITPLQLASAVSAMVNGGVLYEPTFLKMKEGAVPYGSQVIKPETSKQLVYLMNLYIKEKDRMSYQKILTGYNPGGKSGTALKKEGKGYGKERRTSFAGFFPDPSNPRYIVLLTLDSPQPTPATHGFAAAGWNAVPTGYRVIRRISPLLGISPHFNTEELRDSESMRDDLREDRNFPQLVMVKGQDHSFSPED